MNAKPKSEKMRLENISFPAPRNGYAPAEDSWLLAHAIEKNTRAVREKKCLDMGCGSGIQTAALLLSGASRVESVDINEDALRATQKMAEKYFPEKTNQVNYVHSFLFEKVNRQTFDCIVFNPPYVPSETIRWAEVDGGKKGREIIDAFLDALPAHLNEGGCCLLLQSSLNSLYLTRKKCAEKGMRCRIVARERAAFEELLVVKITRQ